jgi:hypothetical protein
MTRYLFAPGLWLGLAAALAGSPEVLFLPCLRLQRSQMHGVLLSCTMAPASLTLTGTHRSDTCHPDRREGSRLDSCRFLTLLRFVRNDMLRSLSSWIEE